MHDSDYVSDKEKQNDVPIDIRMEQYPTNEVIYQLNYGVPNEDSKIDQSYTKDESPKDGVRNQLGSTGALEEYTAAEEGTPWFFDEISEPRGRIRRFLLPLLVAVGLFLLGVLSFT